MYKWSLIASLLLALTGCATVYVSPKVDPGDGSVQVMALTAQSVQTANQAQYTPKQLPAVFFQNAGGAGQLRGTSTPPEPTALRENRPNALQMRIPPQVTPQPYRIGVGDVLLLATKSSSSSVEELSGLLAAQNSRQGYTVQDDGAIAVPDVGRIQVMNMTLEEAESQLFQNLVESGIDPTFSLEIAEFNSKRVSLGGAVGNPTVAPITLTPLYLDEALTAAGGIQTNDLDYASIRIYRDGSLYQVPLSAYLEQPELQKLRLVAGDSIYVDTQYQLDRAQDYFAEQIQLAQFRQSSRSQALSELSTEIALRRAALGEERANFQSRIQLDAVDRDFVYLTGEVNQPGRFAMPFGRQATLADALFSSGGFSSETGNPGQIYVLRGASNSDLVTAWHLDARNVANMVLATKMRVQPNDVVFIAEQPITRWNRALKQIFPTLLSTSAAVSD